MERGIEVEQGKRETRDRKSGDRKREGEVVWFKKRRSPGNMTTSKETDLTGRGEVESGRG